MQSTELRAQSTEHRAQSTELMAQGTERRALTAQLKLCPFKESSCSSSREVAL